MSYHHLTFTNRLQIEAWDRVNTPVEVMAENLGVHVSTVYRELKRGRYTHLNSDLTTKERYSPDIAEERYRENLKAKGAPLKIGNDHKYAQYLEYKVSVEKYAPGAILGEIKRKGIEFDTQVSFTTEGNQRKQPDFIVHLPGKRDLIIDSKMSLTAYLEWQAATDDEQKQKHLKEHIQSIEKHIKELSAQDYTSLLPHEKLDFTFMFIPIEYAYFIAVQAKPELNELARKHRIAIVTASNLFSVLQIADNLWRMERGSQLVDKIFKTAQEMMERTGRFGERMADLHTRLTQLSKSYEDADKALYISKKKRNCVTLVPFEEKI